MSTSYPPMKEDCCAHCKTTGPVDINSDYEYLCAPCMEVYLKRCRYHSYDGKIVYLKSKIRMLERQLEETKAELPDATVNAIEAKRQYNQALEFQKNEQESA